MSALRDFLLHEDWCDKIESDGQKPCDCGLEAAEAELDRTVTLVRELKELVADCWGQESGWFLDKREKDRRDTLFVRADALPPPRYHRERRG